MIEEVTRQHERRVRERVLESVEGFLPVPFQDLQPARTQPEKEFSRLGQPLPYREAVEAVERARFERNTPVVHVTARVPSVTLDHGLSGSEIAARATAATAAERAGHTEATLRLDASKSTAAGVATHGSQPFWVTSVDVAPTFHSITVYIAREYAEGSCEYRETLRHEMEHVGVDRALLEEYAGRMRAALVFSALPTRTYPLMVGSTAEGEDRTNALVRGTLEPIYNGLRRRLHEANAALDTPERYAPVYARCHHW